MARRRSGKQKKTISGVSAPSLSKSVGSAADAPEPIDEKRFSWSAKFVDHEHKDSWDWDLSPRETTEMLRMLEEMGNLSWREVKGLKANSKNRTRPLNHSQSVESICTEAQRRLSHLQLDLDEVFRLRHGNMTRIWGYLQGPVFYLIWYDRNHAVCPSAN